MDKIINILLLVIIFVFDPLAIALVVAANFAFEKIGGKRKEDKDEFKIIHEVEKEVIKEVPVEVIKEIEVEKIVEKEVPVEVEKIVEVPKEVIVEKEVIKEVPVEVIREVEVEKQGYATSGLVKPELSEEDKKWDLDGDGILNDLEMEMKIIDKENQLLTGAESNWKKQKIQKQRDEREKNLENEIENKFGYKINIQKEKEIHSQFKLGRGNSSAPIEGDVNFPSWLRIKYRKMKDNRRDDDDLTITYS